MPPGIEVFERGWLSANNIFHFGEDNVSLVDSGYYAHQSMTLDLVRNTLDKHGLSTLNQIVNTHLHSDHCGGNAELAKTYDCEIYIPAAEALAVESWDIDLLSYQNLGQECPRFMYDGLLIPGQEIKLGRYPWRVLSAPGHAHSVIFYQEQHGILISADALWESGFGVVFPELEGISAFNDVGLTLDLIESLQPLHVIPGHGQCFHDLPTALNVARKKLDGFMQNPHKHAMYGAKVLIKFKMLEWGEVGQNTFKAWASEHSHLRSLHRLECPEQDYAEWVRMVLAELVRSQALRLNDEIIINL